MEMKINTDSGEKTIKLKPLLAKEVDKGFSLFISMDKAELEDKATSMEKYLNYLGELVTKVSGMTKEDLGNLYSEERDKITLYVQKKIQNKIDFLKSSLKSEN